MKIPVIRQIVEKYSLEELKRAEEALMNEQAPDIAIEGEDEGEQLTHIIAGIEILSDCECSDIPVAKALRNYSQRVRNSIS